MQKPQAPSKVPTEVLIARLEAKYVPTPKSVAQSIKPLKKVTPSMYQIAGRIDPQVRASLAAMVIR